MTIATFDAIDGPLERAINLIEASAGTGKTYTIAMLVLRFVVEQDIAIEQQLVVTFTRAATEELRVRIRARLHDALGYVQDVRYAAGAGKRKSGYLQADAADAADASEDDELVRWIARLDIPRETIILRLRTALVDIDRASILTIHGLCQRLLSEFPLDGRQQFEQELMADTSAIMQNIVDDFWRQEFYPRPLTEVAALRWRYPSPEALYNSVRGIDWHQKIYPEALDGAGEQDSDALQDALAELAHQSTVLQKRWADEGAPLYNTIAKMVDEGCCMKSYSDTFESSWQQLEQFCSASVSDIPSTAVLNMLSLETLGSDKGLKAKFRTEASSLQFEPLDLYVAALERVQLQLRWQLLKWISSNYEARMERAGLLSFDSLIVRVGELLEGEKSTHLKRVIQEKYQVALIDEFQDTDQTQWSIFFKLFGGEQHYLYLIGDPKQAIYKFRGADIFTYFGAQNKATQIYTLKHNWRSTPPLVGSINRLFSEHQQPFLFEQLEFHEVAPARAVVDGHVAVNGAIGAPMVLWQLPESEQKNRFWSAAKAEGVIRREVVAEILKLIADDSSAKIVEGAQQRTITPADIAILVRTHKQAVELQGLLAGVGIASVHRGSANIFSSDEAAGLLQLLQAVATPGDLNQLKRLLTLSWSGLDGVALHAILESDQRLGEWLDHLHRLHQLWQESGVMAMIGAAINELLIHHIAQRPDAERVLTNINHLAELLQRQSDEESLSIHKTVAWLQGEIHEGSADSEESISEQQLRLESDDEALQIITMHSSKGLEFPIVFAPYLWQRLAFLESEKNKISCHEAGRLITDIGSADFERRREQAIKEELAEELRLLYVALTRAKYRCYLAWGDVRTTKQPNRSALAYLLFSGGGDEWQASLEDVGYEQQQQRLSTLATQFAEQFNYCELALSTPLKAHNNTVVERSELHARRSTRRFDRSWQMSSYSGLVHLSASHALHQSPEIPVDKAQESITESRATAVESELPKGAHFGNVLHELLELQSFAEIAQGRVDSVLRERLSQRYGLELDNPQHLEQLLQRVVTTPLASDDATFTLANIDPAKQLKEMPFYLSMKRVNTAQINRLLEGDGAVDRLHEIDLEGYLTGFIDLIVEHSGRYYLLDYKSNYLDSYTTPELEGAMHQHNYGLQYWIYSVVLHRYLKGRISHYSYGEHFGGVLYLFVRGMEPQCPQSGVYSVRPDETILMELSRTMGGES